MYGDGEAKKRREIYKPVLLNPVVEQWLTDWRLEVANITERLSPVCNTYSNKT